MNIENKELLGVLEKVKNSSNNEKYDCIVPISGGKDGTFILWYLRKYTNLNCVAYHIDNYYVADGARQNALNITKKLDVDLMIYRPAWNDTQKIYRELLTKMGEICVACEFMINFYPFIFAIEEKIPNIIWGLTPNQLKSKHITSGCQSTDFTFYTGMLSYYREIFNSLFDNELPKELDNKWFSINTRYSDSDFPSFVFPFYYMGYDANELEDLIKKELHWERSADVGGSSSNCTINNLHICLKRALKGEGFYEEMLKKKKNNNEVTENVVTHALKNGEFSDYSCFLKDLDVSYTEQELLDKINSYKKGILLRKESNISQ
jgi:hypothetical protein